ncbi:MAG: hypothetical protein CM1200mP36_05960 [Gammaproteobacteria bacterium]|nr:MAG: hypothetical protein CM1200mP36_05960 [Gammaproteobacteria bacterium]
MPPSWRLYECHWQHPRLGDAAQADLSLDVAYVSLQRLVFSWSVAALAGTNVCLRGVQPSAVFESIMEYGVTHYVALRS